MELTGKRFGRLVVLRLADEPYISPSSGIKIPRWICQCDCGKEVTVTQNLLTATKNGTKSCGCGKREAAVANAINMEGQRFGRLVVIGYAPLPHPLNNGQRNGWLCRCDCGNEKVYLRKELLSGKVLSCGCLLKEIAKKKVSEENVVGYYDGTMVSVLNPSRPANRNCKSGIKGVYWNKREQRWIAHITLRGKKITLGRFCSSEEAAQARKAAEEKYFAPIIKDYQQKHGKE
ncbi:MAG: hypothetical protein DBY45_10240 [Clostridiales bacterium]|nr:MAG: hypothetical protein DBY45_10240 [Clostridiales bacterium]